MNGRMYLVGACEYVVKSQKNARLLNELTCGFCLRNVCVTENNTAHFCAYFRDCRDIEEILKENEAEICKKKCYGLGYLLSKYKKRTGFFVGLLFAVTIVYLSSLFVWEISVEGNEKVTDKEIEALLENVGFCRGTRKKKADIEKIINACLIADERLSWMSINYDGTMAYVLIKEARLAEKKTRKENVNIVANRDGIIVRVDALGGEATVEKGQTVTRGEMLISSFVSKRTGGSIMHGARGFVWAMTQRKYCVFVPLEYYEKQYMGKVKNRYEISFLSRHISLPFFGESKKSNLSFEYSKSKKQISLFDKGKIPVFCSVTTKREYIESVKRRSEKEALQIAKNEAMEQLKRASSSFVCVSKEESFEICDGALVYVCSFDGIENIARELEFETA